MPLHPFQKLIQENRACGMDNTEAVRQARDSDPASYQAWLDDFNARHNQAVNNPKIKRQCQVGA